MKASLFVLGCLFATQQAAAQQVEPSVPALAGAYDRCMATYAVRMTKTAATDDQIFAEATRSCSELKGKLAAAIRAQLPAAQADQLLRSIDAQGKPGFLKMLAKIRSDRAARAGG